MSRGKQRRDLAAQGSGKGQSTATSRKGNDATPQAPGKKHNNPEPYVKRLQETLPPLSRPTRWGERAPLAGQDGRREPERTQCKHRKINHINIII